MSVRFGILGPVLLEQDGIAVAITSGKQRAVLAVLLLHANRAVTADRLVDEVWGERPPASARRLVSTYIWRLRALLGDEDGPHGRLRHRPDGYRLRVDEGELDAAQFDWLCVQGRALLAAGDAAGAAAALGSALALWRGEPLADAPLLGQSAGEAARRLEQRVSALEQRAEADLALGHHDALIAELRHLHEEHPARQRFAVQLMTALDRAGRRGEALEVYRRARVWSVRELGLEPGGDLAALQQALLRADGAAGSAPGGGQRPGPTQLPAADAVFRGRAAEIARLDALLARHRRRRAAGVPLTIVVTGPPGIGKTSLALRWAHQVRGEFPDGQLFASLHGHSGSQPVGAGRVMRGFLRALELRAGEIPVDADEAAARLRTLISGRRILFVLDDAADAETAAALLPGHPEAVVVITSRDPLTDLALRFGAHVTALAPLSEADSRALLSGALRSGAALAGAVGPDDRLADRAATDELAGLCGHLPLALRLAAAHLDAHPGVAVADYVAQMRRGDPIAVLDPAGGTMRRAFGYSYQSLPPAEARAFRLLGLLTGPDITVDGAAALLDSRSHDAHRALDRLARAHLVARAGPGRFTLHDLLGAYAADRAREQDPDTAREAALDRWLDWCLATALAADRLLDPLRFRAPFDDFPTASRDPVLTTRAEAVAWLDAERANLVAAAFQAARHGRVQRAWHLAWALWSYFDLRKPWSDWIETYRLGLSCARAGGDRHGEAVMQYGLGVAHYYPRRFADALDCLRPALRLHRENGERRGEGTVLNCIANVRLESGDPVAAVALYQQALDIQVRAGSRRDESVVLNNLTEAYNKLGRHREAVTCAQRALDLAREGGSRRGEFFPLCHLANALAATGDRARARELLAGALALADENRDPHARAWALCYIGAIARDEGRVREARQAWRESVGLFASLGDPNGEDVLARLAELDGQPPPADAGRGPGSVGEEPEPCPG